MHLFNIHKTIVSIACCFLLSSASVAQNVEFSKDNFKNDKEGLKNAQKSIKQGDQLFELGTFMYNQAVDFYLKANEFNPDNALLNYKIGLCHLYSSYKIKSLQYLEKAYKLDSQLEKNNNLDGNTYPDIHFLLGRAYHLNMDWEKATKEYKLHLPKVSGDPDKKAEVNKKIMECKTGAELVQKPVRVFIDNIGKEINSPYPDYGPAISADESVILFTSRRENSTGADKNPDNPEFYEDIYISTNTDGKWSEAENLGAPINTEGHDATMGLSADGQKLLIYLDDKGDGNIYECTLKGDMWSKPQKMSDNINTKYHESSASLSPDGKTLYFVSNKPDDNLGMHDIYKVTMDKNKKWGKPVNLGPTINTKFNDESCFIHPDGKTLYFSSQGHKTMGGYDIFKSVFENGKWSEPVNLGYPINSPDDDIDFVVAASGKHAYCSSIKNSGVGEKDIYMITFLGPEKTPLLSNEDKLLASASDPTKETFMASAVEIKTAQLTILKGTVTDAGDHHPLEATIDLIDNQKNEVIASFTSNSVSGKYLVSLPSGKNYGIAVKADGYLFHSENFDIPASAAYQEVVKDVQLGKLVAGSKIILNNIFFDVDKWSLRPESTNELERLMKLMNDLPTLKIEISGHTDNTGSAAHNQPLSENRAKSVVDYLISKGIDKNRMVYKGYGFAQPISSNDTEEGRQQNRRTEFKILSK